MRNKITLTTDRLGELLAASYTTSTREQHDATCQAFRWMVACLTETNEEAERFYDTACCKAAQILGNKK